MRWTAVVPALVLVLGLGFSGSVAEAQNVEAFSIVSDSLGPGATDGRNRLQWVTPATAVVTDTFIIRYRTVAGPCQPTDYPNDPSVASPDPLVPGIPAVVPDSTQSLAHTGLILDQWHCYSIWVFDGVATYYGPETMKGRPFDSGGAVKWKYSTGTTSLAAPTVGLYGVLVPSNDTYVHAMERDPASAGVGAWPAGYRPSPLDDVANEVVQHRVPIVPLGGVWTAFLSTQNGTVYAVDTSDGSVLWSTPLPEGAAQGAPAGVFTAFGGAFDYVLAGTSAGGDINKLYALDPSTGAVVDSYPQSADPGFSSMGAVLGMPSVDYATSRVYFASLAQGPTIWCLDLGPAGDALQHCSGWTEFAVSDDIDGSVVLFNGRVLAGAVRSGSGSSEVFSLSAADGTFYSYILDGGVMGFLFPDRRGDDLYAAVYGKSGPNDVPWVKAITDAGTLSTRWTSPVLVDPSVVLYHPGTDDIYVGVRDRDGDGLAPFLPAIVKVSAVDGSIVSWVDLEPDLNSAIGPPSLDRVHGILYAGSEAGIVYAVDLSAF